METLLNVINAMLNRASCATMNEYLMARIIFFGLLLAMLVTAISALRLGVQLYIKKTIK